MPNSSLEHFELPTIPIPPLVVQDVPPARLGGERNTTAPSVAAQDEPVDLDENSEHEMQPIEEEGEDNESTPVDNFDAQQLPSRSDPPEPQDRAPASFE